MPKIIDIGKARDTQKRPETQETVITATNYYLCRGNEHGKEIYREQFNGSEYITTTCPVCGKEFWLDFFEFCEIVVSGFDFYGTAIYCRECSAKRNNED